jgi:hypothetical protein
MLGILTLSLSLCCAGCRTAPLVIPADRAVTRLAPGKAFVAPVPGWFVPDARMQEILRKVSERVLEEGRLRDAGTNGPQETGTKGLRE